MVASYNRGDRFMDMTNQPTRIATIQCVWAGERALEVRGQHGGLISRVPVTAHGIVELNAYADLAYPGCRVEISNDAQGLPFGSIYPGEQESADPGNLVLRAADAINRRSAPCSCPPNDCEAHASVDSAVVCRVALVDPAAPNAQNSPVPRPVGKQQP